MEGLSSSSESLPPRSHARRKTKFCLLVEHWPVQNENTFPAGRMPRSAKNWPHVVNVRLLVTSYEMLSIESGSLAPAASIFFGIPSFSISS